MTTNHHTEHLPKYTQDLSYDWAANMSTEDVAYLEQALELARKAPALPTNFRVGAVIVSDRQVLATGYTMELPGNTHAEECALEKLAADASSATLYTTLEPCGKRLSGNTPCVDRILASTINRVVFGAKEPDTFIKDSESCKRMTEAGLKWEYIPDLETEILKVAKEGHKSVTSVDVDPEERERQQQQPRNPKKRMMEVT